MQKEGETIDATLQTVEPAPFRATEGPLLNCSDALSHCTTAIIGDDDPEGLRQQLRLAEINNGLLQNNVNTLKAVAHQLAAQLDMVNEQLMLYKEKAAVWQVIEEHKQADGERANCESDNNDYEERLAALRAALKEKDECLAELRYEIVRRDSKANALLLSVKQERDTTVTCLMNELDELRREKDKDKRYRVKRK